MSNVETKAARAEAAKAKVEAATADAALKAKVCLAPVVCPAAKAPLAPTQWCWSNRCKVKEWC